MGGKAHSPAPLDREARVSSPRGFVAHAPRFPRLFWAGAPPAYDGRLLSPSSYGGTPIIGRFDPAGVLV